MKRSSKYILVPALLIQSAVCFAQPGNYVAIHPTDAPATIISKAANVIPSPRQVRWQELELVAFFHFGINTFTGREWGDGKEDPALFNPTNLDAEQWVKSVKNAGFKQVILTAKHHDGFCLWPTASTEHSVKSSPWKNGKGDVVKELSAACKKYGIGFGIYLSPWDRNHHQYGSDTYNDIFIQQLTELLSNYGQVDEVWFDGANGEGPNGKKQVYDFDRWYRLIRKLQPKAVIAVMGPDVRWVGTESGYGRATEWSVLPVNKLNPEAIAGNSQQTVAFKPEGDRMGEVLGSRAQLMDAKGLVWYPAETDVSIRPGWFYHAAEDAKVKAGKELLDIYFHSVGRNGLLLLNIPPDKRGLITDADIKALQEWKKLRTQVFKKNLLKGSRFVVPHGLNERSLVDGNYKTGLNYYSNDSTISVEIVLKRAAAFNMLQLQENITRGQKIENFELEYYSNDGWTLLAKGTTVGYKRMIGFKTVTSHRLRLSITSSRGKPFLSELGLYQQDIIQKDF